MVSALGLRPATKDDARRLYAWRNDPVTVAASASGRPVAWDEHLSWLDKALSDPSRRIMIAELGDEAVGMARYDQACEGVAELSWLIAPRARGRGLGKALVLAAAARHAGPLLARIKEDNVASIRVAMAAGFQLVEVRDGMGLWRRPAGPITVVSPEETNC
ncbi:MAG: GNAT family N-acetyltransferase [Pseudomonadota bacterium]